MAISWAVAQPSEIARLQPNDHAALCRNASRNTGTPPILKDRRRGDGRCGELRAWIEREIHLDLTNAPFDPQDERFCQTRSVRSLPETNGSNHFFFPRIRRKSIARTENATELRSKHSVQIQVKPLEEKGEKPLRVSPGPPR